MIKQYMKEVQLSARNVGVSVVQLMNNIVIPASGASMVEIDSTTVEQAQIFIGASANFTIQAYPKFNGINDGNNLVAGSSIIAIATNVNPPSAGRTFSYKMNSSTNNVFPSKTVRFMITNNDSVNTNTINLWIVAKG